jgi:hypothetical protein
VECSVQWGVVSSMIHDGPHRQELVVQVGGEQAQAINYPGLTGSCQAGDSVLLNTTALELKLGTGGWHYVLAIQGRERSLSRQGHIMKLRYTPLQGRTLAVEEEDSPYHETMAKADSLHGLPVAVGSLHSMLAPLAWTFHQQGKPKRLVYLMSDGAALPLSFSNIVSILKERGLIHSTITFGHAFGGDLEAVNIYSALLAAKHVAQGDAAVVLMGPGVVGTGTKWGTTALEQGIYLNAAAQLDGQAIAIPRLSEQDVRRRHQGLSHHSLTVLTKVVQTPVYVPMPNYFQTVFPQSRQLEGLRHRIVWEATEEGFRELFQAELSFSTMGRNVEDDPLFFHGVVAAALFLARLT